MEIQDNKQTEYNIDMTSKAMRQVNTKYQERESNPARPEKD